AADRSCQNGIAVNPPLNQQSAIRNPQSAIRNPQCSGPCPPSGPSEVGAAVPDGGLAQLGARLTAAARRRERLLPRAALPHHDQILDAAVRRQLAIIGAVQLEELAHLVEPRPHPVTDAEQ